MLYPFQLLWAVEVHQVKIVHILKLLELLLGPVLVKYAQVLMFARFVHTSTGRTLGIFFWGVEVRWTTNCENQNFNPLSGKILGC